MAGSLRKSKKSRAKVKVGLPKKHPRVFKPAFSLPPKLKSIVDASGSKWDDKGSVIQNYSSFGFVSNPNLLGVQSRTPHLIQNPSLQLPPPSSGDANPVSEPDPLDSGSDLEEDDLKSLLGKKRRDGKTAPLQPLTAMQRHHISRLVEKYGDDYQAMFRDTKLNSMQHSVGTLKILCKRYLSSERKNPFCLRK